MYEKGVKPVTIQCLRLGNCLLRFVIVAVIIHLYDEKQLL